MKRTLHVTPNITKEDKELDEISFQSGLIMFRVNLRTGWRHENNV